MTSVCLAFALAAPAPGIPPRPEPRPNTVARPMLIAGATLTALAGVAGIGMITALVVWSRSTNERLMAETPEDIEASAAQQEASEAGAIATGVIMGAAFLTGVPLLVVAVQRRKKAVRMTALPTPGGVAFTISGRF